MTFTRLILVSAAAVLALSELSLPGSRGLAASSQETAARETVRIRVTDFPRPVHAAVRQVEGQFGRPVTYEDAPYVYSGDIVDVTAQVSRSGDMSKRILGRRPGSIDVSYVPQKASIDAQVEDVLRAVVEQASAADLAGDFSVRPVAGGFHVVPTARKGKNGVKEPFTSVLDARITIPETEDGILEVLALLGQAISRSTETLVAPGVVPVGGGFSRARVTVVARDEPARDVLWRALQSVSPDLSWAVLCEVGEKSACYISIHPVRKGYVHPAFK